MARNIALAISYLTNEPMVIRLLVRSATVTIRMFWGIYIHLFNNRGNSFVPRRLLVCRISIIRGRGGATVLRALS